MDFDNRMWDPTMKVGEINPSASLLSKTGTSYEAEINICHPF